MQIGTLLVVSVGQVFSGKMANFYHSGDFKKYYNIASIGIAIAFLIGLFAILFSYLLGEKIMKNLLDHNNSDNLMTYIFLMAPFQYMMTIFGYIQGATRKSKNLLIVNILVFTVVSVLSLLLIPNYKIYGMISAMLIASILGCFIYAFILIKGYNKQVIS